LLAEQIKTQQQAAGQTAYLKSVPKDKSGSPTETFDTWQAGQTKAVEQSIEEGDPVVVGQALAHGLVAPSQVISSRSMSKAFYSRVLQAANEATPGGAFNMMKAEAQYKYASNPQTLNTLNMINAMSEKGGSIDIARGAAQQLPQINSKLGNEVWNATATQFGSPEATNFHTAMLGLADEYSKVMGGGVSSDTGRQQALDILKAGYSKGQLAGAIEVMNQDIVARRSAMVGDNPTLQVLYPGPATETGAADTTPGQSAPGRAPLAPAYRLHQSLNDFAHHLSGAKGDIYSDDGRTWYDHTGQPVTGRQ